MVFWVVLGVFFLTTWGQTLVSTSRFEVVGQGLAKRFASRLQKGSVLNGDLGHCGVHSGQPGVKPWFRVQGLRFEVQGLGFRVRVRGPARVRKNVLLHVG